jgi:hypothetical protein
MNPSFAVAGPPAPANPDDQTPDRSGAPACWMKGGYGRNTARWQRVRYAASGRWAMRLTVSAYHSGGAELLPLFDLGACSLPAQAGKGYQLAAEYQSTASTQFAVYYRDAAGRWRYWTSSPYFPPAGHWARAHWQTPPVPAGASGLSFGLSLFSDGTLVTARYSFAASGHPLGRMVLDGALLAVAVLAAALALIRRARGMARPQAAGTAPQTTLPPAVSGRRAL